MSKMPKAETTTFYRGYQIKPSMYGYMVQKDGFTICTSNTIAEARANIDLVA